MIGGVHDSGPDFFRLYGADVYFRWRNFGSRSADPELRRQAVLLGLDCCRSVRLRVIFVGAHSSGADADDGCTPGRLRVRNCNDVVIPAIAGAPVRFF